jgi:hypothetical protein
MKRLISLVVAALIIAASASVAHAESASDEYKIQQICRLAGNLAEQGFTDRTTYGQNPMTPESRAGWSSGIFEFAYDYGKQSASDQRDAHMFVFSKCLDRIREANGRPAGQYMTEQEVMD